MKSSILVIITFLFQINISSANDVKTPKVPSEITIAGMKLKITESARRDIQEHINSLHSSPTYFNIKLDRVKLYFPIIEKIFKEEGIPDDFKFLAIQESALISDAVSSANAVGFWQFKDFTGREVGLRIDKNVDERLNIVSSTYGVTKYFRRHNFYFKNWIYTILAHMTGRGGAMKHVDKKQFGAKKMTIDRNTHWYVKHYIAHVIAFKDVLKGQHSEGLSLLPYEKGAGKSLEQIAKNFKVEIGYLKKYNKWLKRGKVPAEKLYTVLIPTTKKVKLSPDKKSIKKLDVKEVEELISATKKTYSNLKNKLNSSNTIYIKINGIPSILAKKMDTSDSLAKKGNILLRKFLKYNDMTAEDATLEGEIYYLRKKKNKANIYFYTVAQKESLWTISQKFGIKLSKLAKLNRMLTIDDPELGRVMWLREKRPKNTAIEIKEIVEYVEEQAIISQAKFQEIPEKKEAKKAITKNEKEAKKEKNEVYQPFEGVPEKNENKLSSRKNTSFVHEVKPGETLYAIARTYNVSVDGIKKWNELKSSSLSLGQQLKIYRSEGNEKPTPEKKKAAKKEIVKKTNAKKEILHTVKSGDTLYGIARKYEVSVDDILKWNDLKSSSLNLGQRLKIKPQKVQTKVKEQKAPKPSTDKVTFHVVKSGDTLYGISRKYNVSVADILKMNNKENVSLEIGEKIKVRD